METSINFCASSRQLIFKDPVRWPINSLALVPATVPDLKLVIRIFSFNVRWAASKCLNQRQLNRNLISNCIRLESAFKPSNKISLHNFSRLLLFMAFVTLKYISCHLGLAAEIWTARKIRASMTKKEPKEVASVYQRRTQRGQTLGSYGKHLLEVCPKPSRGGTVFCHSSLRRKSRRHQKEPGFMKIVERAIYKV